MERSMFTDTELQLTTERSTKYQGTAKINLSQIAFHPSLSRELDQKNVERLCEIFNKDGCRRLDIQHHVTAVVSQQHLANALHAAHVTAHALMTNPPDRYPQLQFPTGQIRCLHGQHRLKAGEELLPPSDQWWTVDLYLDDISSGLQASLVDEYSNEKPPSDGEVYRKVRQYQYEANSRFEERWKSRLSSNKAKRLRQLSSPAHVDVRAAFDALLAIPGLWNGMNLGSLHRVLALNCDEEIVTYLTHVKQFWSSLVDDDRDKMMKIDLHTVEILQLLAPGVSRKDAKTVRGVVLGGEAFANFNDSDRAAIWNKLQGKREIIPSLHTFFQDIYYLEACANCVKRLVALSRLRPTLRSAVWGSLKPPDPAVRNCMIQTSETGQRRSGSPAQRAELGYRQLWLYAMRHYPKMPREPESDDLVARPGHEKADETALHEMAVLAQNLGFDSTRITDLIELSPDRQIARAVLLKARDPERFRYDSGIFETLIGRIAECFSLAVPVERQLSCDFTSGSEAKLNARCGLPHARAQQQDRRFLFLDQLHTNEMPAGGKVSTLFVRRCVYFAFFGKPLTSPPPQHTWVGAATSASDPPNLPMSPLFVPDDSPLAGFGQLPLQENDGCTAVNHGELDPMQLDSAERATAEETGVRREVTERYAAEQERQEEEEARAAAEQYAAEQEQLRQEQLRQEEEARAAAERYAAEQEQLQQEEEARAAAERYAAEQEQLRQEQLRQEEEEARAAAERYAAEQEQLRQEQLRQEEEEARAAAEQYAAEQEQLRQEQLRQEQLRQEQLQQEEEEARATAERYAAEQEQLRRDAEEAAAEQVKREQILREEEERHTVERAEQEQVQKEAEERAAIEHAAGEAHFQQEAEERAVAEQADQERLAREAAGPVQLQPGEEDWAAVGTAAEEMRTPRPVTQLDFTPFMSSKGEGAHSTIDPASTERATNVADPALEVESRKAVERTTGSTRLEGPVSQTRQGKLRKPGVIPKASERGVSPQGTARKAAAERSLKTDNRLQGSQPDSGLQGASRLEDVSTGARTVTIIFKAREKGKWVDTYEMTINPSEPSDRSMVERMAKKDARNRQATFYDKDLKLIAPTQCLDAAIEDGTNTVLMAFGGELNVDEEMVASVSQDTDSERKQERKTKRRA